MSAAIAAPALAHHSAAAFDTQKEVKLTGTVKVYTFKNPHVYMTVQVRSRWIYGLVEVEAGAASVSEPARFYKGFGEGGRGCYHHREPRPEQSRETDAGERSRQE